MRRIGAPSIWYLSAPARKFVGVTFLRAPRGLGERLPVHLVVCGAGRCRPGDPWVLAVMGACAWGHVATVFRAGGQPAGVAGHRDLGGHVGPPPAAATVRTCPAG